MNRTSNIGSIGRLPRCSISLLRLIVVITWCSGLSCQNIRKEDETRKADVLQLSREVEVYNPELAGTEVVLAVEGGGKSAYVLDKSGKKLFTWSFDASLGNDLELLSDGRVLGMFRVESPAFSFKGGYGGIIRLINPDNSVDWEFEYVSADYLAHHDVEMLPNGNILFLAWEKKEGVEAKASGASVAYDLYPERLVEVDTATKKIVWEWSSWDHLVQDFSPQQENFGDVANSPGRIDINYALQDDGDIMHANGLDYDAERDVIFISVNHYSEVWVVDHSTTTEEAAGRVGGEYNRGGDLLYRFGNPEAYKNKEGNRIFDRVHYPNFLGKGEPGAGNLLVYNNGLKAKRSTVYELAMPEQFQLMPGANNEPPIVWSFADSTLSYGRISGAVRFASGNTLICEGDYGFWEVTPKGEVAWKYKNTQTTFWRGYAYERDSPALSALGIVTR